MPQNIWSSGWISGLEYCMYTCIIHNTMYIYICLHIYDQNLSYFWHPNYEAAHGTCEVLTNERCAAQAQWSLPNNQSLVGLWFQDMTLQNKMETWKKGWFWVTPHIWWLVVRKLVDKSIISYCLAAGFILSQAVQCRVQDSVINSS